jgi:hypothetical protein
MSIWARALKAPSEKSFETSLFVCMFFASPQNVAEEIVSINKVVVRKEKFSKGNLFSATLEWKRNILKFVAQHKLALSSQSSDVAGNGKIINFS